uniref:F-box and leucine rich repeat protein 6 n=1 Tax=Sphenodon punctatus TaxID=8508 RepID=A0A8D0H581_SPHPU
MEEPSAAGRRVPRKRKEAERPKRKKAAARKAPSRPAPDYLVHETDNDMLLIISNVGQEREQPPKRRRLGKKPQRLPRKRAPRGGGRKKGGAPGAKKAAFRGPEAGKAPATHTGRAPGSAWGEQLPVEILVRIFQPVVSSEGAVPFLCRVARVCRLWYGADSNPVLWQKVSVGFCWVAPGLKQPPATEKKILGTVAWLVADRFSLLRDFALCHWKNHVPFVLKAVSDSCPLLSSLSLCHCSRVDTESLHALAERCPQLESLNLQNSQVSSSAVVSFLEAAGSRIRQLLLTYSGQMNAIITTLASGCCPRLQLLEVTTELKQSSQHFQLPIEQLQTACPRLQVLRLLNVIWSPKPIPRSAPASPGFPQLQELCLATTSYSFIDDGVLQRMLQASSQLRILDLRGCFRVTPKGLETLPCPDLEQLYLGLYCSANHLRLPLEGSPLLTRKWRQSLQELDLAGQSFSEHDLEEAMECFTQGGGEVALRSLNLTGTKVTLGTVR